MLLDHVSPAHGEVSHVRGCPFAGTGSTQACTSISYALSQNLRGVDLGRPSPPCAWAVFPTLRQDVPYCAWFCYNDGYKHHVCAGHGWTTGRPSPAATPACILSVCYSVMPLPPTLHSGMRAITSRSALPDLSYLWFGLNCSLLQAAAAPLLDQGATPTHSSNHQLPL